MYDGRVVQVCACRRLPGDRLDMPATVMLGTTVLFTGMYACMRVCMYVCMMHM